MEGSEVVFVGYGVVAPEYGWDDYKDVDVRGKTILMLASDPAVPDPTDPSKLDDRMFKGRKMTYYGRWTYKYEIAARRGRRRRSSFTKPGRRGIRIPWCKRVGTGRFSRWMRRIGTWARCRPRVGHAGRGAEAPRGCGAGFRCAESGGQCGRISGRWRGGHGGFHAEKRGAFVQIAQRARPAGWGRGPRRMDRLHRALGSSRRDAGRGMANRRRFFVARSIMPPAWRRCWGWRRHSRRWSRRCGARCCSWHRRRRNRGCWA